MFHVAHISTAKTWRGGEQQIFYLINTLKGLIKQSLFCEKDSIIKQKVEPIITTVSFKKRGSINILIAREMAFYAKKEKVDLFHIHDSHAHNIYYLSCILFGLKIPAIVTRRIEKPINNFISSKKYNHQGIKKIVCVSDSVKKTLYPFIADKSKLYTIYSGIEIEPYIFKPINNILKQEFKIPIDSKIIGTVGALTHQKDHITFIKTADNIIKSTNENIYFFIVGSGKLEKKIKLEISKRNLNKHIILTGFRSDIPEVIKCFDVFLFTSIFEGLGTVILNAMAAKIPVVSTDVSGIPEMIIHDENGFLSPPKNETLLASQVLTLLTNKAKADLFTERSFKIVQNFTAEQMAIHNLNLYKTILK